ncbi:MAG: carbamoyl-phosphate synthase (glutamine-hydrolyzing) large subunit [Patescibacteria group bacterium]
MKYKKVLILGSGALKIGEAGEFDYSGSQAIKALKEAGIKTVLVNPNIATIQTSDRLADQVYFLPVTREFVEQVIIKEKPDGIMLSFGGQTALNCGIELHKKGILKQQSVTVLGTSVETIIMTEDRAKFAGHLQSINESIPASGAAINQTEALKIARKIGFPVMVRAAYALGGQASGVAQNQKELNKICAEAFMVSPQVLVEKYLHHFKEIEYEVVRDSEDNCLTICNMENMDPLGIHTGESIVVAPSQTLTNFEYHYLRQTAIKIVRSLKVVGECNIQFAVNPRPQGKKLEYYIIEVNSRLSRSSALASKATGYPLAYVAAKLVLGQNLSEIKNQVTQVTQAFFEPALDYVAVKIPRWDLNKFDRISQRIGSSMKSVGEVMGLGRSFEEALQKAARMLNLGYLGVTDKIKIKDLKEELVKPTPNRLWALSEALCRGIAVAELNRLTGIDPWFLERIKLIVDEEAKISHFSQLKRGILLKLKQLGLADKRVGQLVKKTELEVRSLRKKLGIKPSIFQIDTLAGEVPAVTNYLYLTYFGRHDDVKPFKRKGVIVLGSGPYCIGSSVEFDWVSVNAAWALKKFNKQSIIINCNPETVSTDYDVSDRLYFEELTLERVMDIYEAEQPFGVIVSAGGQIPNNLVKPLAKQQVRILGTKAVNIDEAEDRTKFSQLLDDLGLAQPKWDKFSSVKAAIRFAQIIDYPVLIRPSYVLSGSAMRVCHNDVDLNRFFSKAAKVNRDYPVTVSKFITMAREIELDAVAQNGEIMAAIISEHVEPAGTHSGDACIVYPGQKIHSYTENQVRQIAAKLAGRLKITGPFNLQLLAKDNEVMVLEMNLRSSRTFPFISKATEINLARLLVEASFKQAKPVEIKYPDFVAVKVPQFSFARLTGADPQLRVEMASTGEAAGFGKTEEEAFLKAELSVGAKMPRKGIFLSFGGEGNKVRMTEAVWQMKALNLPIFATEKTALWLKKNGLKVKRLFKIHENKSPNLLDCFNRGKVDLAINLVDEGVSKEINDDYMIRRAAIDHNVYLITDVRKARLLTKALVKFKNKSLPVEPWSYYA